MSEPTQEEVISVVSSIFDVSDTELRPDLLKFKIEDEVQCETCHGPGSDYKSKKVMKDKKVAIEKGLLMYDNPEELCVKCHNEEGPHFKGFNFEERWAKIKHRKPE